MMQIDRAKSTARLPRLIPPERLMHPGKLEIQALSLAQARDKDPIAQSLITPASKKVVDIPTIAPRSSPDRIKLARIDSLDLAMQPKQMHFIDREMQEVVLHKKVSECLQDVAVSPPADSEVANAMAWQCGLSHGDIRDHINQAIHDFSRQQAFVSPSNHLPLEYASMDDVLELSHSDDEYLHMGSIRVHPENYSKLIKFAKSWETLDPEGARKQIAASRHEKAQVYVRFTDNEPRFDSSFADQKKVISLSDDDIATFDDEGRLTGNSTITNAHEWQHANNELTGIFAGIPIPFKLDNLAEAHIILGNEAKLAKKSDVMQRLSHRGICRTVLADDPTDRKLVYSIDDFPAYITSKSNKSITGVITWADEVAVFLKDSDGKEIEIPFDEINNPHLNGNQLSLEDLKKFRTERRSVKIAFEPQIPDSFGQKRASKLYTFVSAGPGRVSSPWIIPENERTSTVATASTS